ncbi:MAG: glycosyltransferase [Candidatus Sungbacteria bacterium]|uniref:Glycosyltransferase n=1 Tax=Candidatus Sungiibacteriota bacterium TaxID=2750080 RepID=A0A931SCL8_9BACT|nr:glycosyltransferase [Candidatus Sungbacteria bacterium]
MKRKILFGVTKAGWGGAQRYVFDLITNLPPDKFKVSVMAGAPGLLQNRLETAGIRFIPVSGLGRDIAWLKELEALFGILTAIRKEKPDVLHLNSPKMSGLGAFAGRLLGVPRIIVTVHGWSFAEDRHLGSRRCWRIKSS